MHLLSILASCDVCKGSLTARFRNDVRLYVCRDAGQVKINADALDDHAARVILAYLSRADVAAMLAASSATSPELDQVRADVAEVRRQLDKLYAEVATGRLSPGALAAIEPGLLARVEDARERERELSAPNGLAALLDGGAARWESMPMSARREVVRVVCSPDLLGELRVGRASGPTPVEARAVWRRA